LLRYHDDSIRRAPGILPLNFPVKIPGETTKKASLKHIASQVATLIVAPTDGLKKMLVFYVILLFNPRGRYTDRYKRGILGEFDITKN
jgi:hypothetical protein